MADFDNFQSEEGTKPFEDGYMGFDARLESRRFDDESFRMPPHYSEEHLDEEAKDDGYDMVNDAAEYEPPAFGNGFNHGVHVDSQSPFNESFSSEQQPDFASRGDFSPVSDLNGHTFPAPDEPVGYEFMQQPFGSGSGNGSVLPPPEEMEPEEGFLLREWKKENASRLAEKERAEKERQTFIIEDAEAYKEEFFGKRKSHCEAQKNNNRDKEKVFVAGQEHFHKTAEKHYWKAVSELIPTEVAAFETKRGNKDKKKVTVIFNQGPKPGKATDLTRMRQVLLKLKHNPPDHMKTAPPPPPPPPPAAAKAEGEKEDGQAATAPAAVTSAAPAVEVAA